MSERKENVVLHSSIFRYFEINGEEEESEKGNGFALKYCEKTHLKHLLQSMHQFAADGVLTNKQYKDVWNVIVEQEVKMTVLQDEQADFIASLQRFAPKTASEEGISYNTAVVIVPDKATSDRIQKIRRQHDQRHVDIWPAHVTLFYPFVPPSLLNVVIPELKSACKDVKEFQLSCEKFGEFNHGKQKGFVSYLDPEPAEEINALHQTLTQVVEKYMKVKPLRQSHITVARGQPHSMVQTLQGIWNAAKFNVAKVVVLERDDNKSPMKTVAEINFGDKDNDEDAPEHTSAGAIGVNGVLKVIEQSTKNGFLTWARALQLRKIVLFPSASGDDGVDTNVLTTLEEELEVAYAVFGPQCIEENDVVSNKTVVNFSYTLDSATSDDIVVDCVVALCDDHPHTVPSASVARVFGLSSSLSFVFQQAFESFTRDWMEGNAFIGKTHYSGTFVYGLYELIDELVRGQLYFNNKIKAQAKETVVKGITNNFKELLNWREMTEAIAKESRGVGVKAADKCVFEALLQHLDKYRDKHAHTYKLIHVENIMQPFVIEQFNNKVEENVQDFRHPHNHKQQHQQHDSVSASGLSSSQRKRRIEKKANERIVLFPNDFDDKSHLEVVKRFAPRLAFHGTSSTFKSASIAADGLKAAGEYTSDGVLIQMAMGDVLGPGAYVSPSFEKSHWYSYADSNGHYQMVVGVVVPGKCCLYSPENIMRLRRNNETIRNLECDSHLSPCKDELILYESECFLPCLLVNYSYRETANIPQQPQLKGSVDVLKRNNYTVKAHLVSVSTATPDDEQQKKEDEKQKLVANKHKQHQQQKDQQQKHSSSYHRLFESIGPSQRLDIEQQLQEELWMLEIPSSMAHRNINNSVKHIVVCIDCDSVNKRKKKTNDYFTELQRSIDLFLRRACADVVSVVVHDAGVIIECTQELSCKHAAQHICEQLNAYLKGGDRWRTSVLSKRLKSSSVCEALEELCLSSENKKYGKDREYTFGLAELWLARDLYRAAKSAFPQLHLDVPNQIYDKRAEHAISQSSLTHKIAQAVKKHVATLPEAQVECKKDKDTEEKTTTEKEEENEEGGRERANTNTQPKRTVKELLPKEKYHQQLKKRVEFLLDTLCPQQVNVICCFVPPNAGNEQAMTPLYPDDTTLDAVHGRLSRASVTVLPIVLKTGKLSNAMQSNACIQSYLCMKAALQTVSIYEPKAFFHAQRSVNVPQTCGDVARFIRAVTGQSVNVSVRDESLHMGFVTSLLNPPQHFVSLSTSTDTASTASTMTGGSSSSFRNCENVFCLMRGRPPRCVVINGRPCSVQLAARDRLMKELQEERKRGTKQSKASKMQEERKKEAEEEELRDSGIIPHTSAEVQSAIAATLTSLVTQLKELVAHKHESVRKALCVMASVLNKLIAEQQHDPIDLKRLDYSDRIELISNRRQHVLQMQMCLNTVYTMCAMEMEKLQLPPNASWVVLARSMKHGARALKRAKVLNMSTTATESSTITLFNLHKTIENMEESLSECIQNQQGGDVSNQSKMNTFEHITSMVAFRDAMSSFIEEDLTLSKAINDKAAWKKNKKGSGKKRKNGKSMSANPSSAAVKRRRVVRFPYSNTQMLYAVGVTGVMIDVVFSEASNINPWEIKVRKVSLEFGDTSSSLCALDAGLRVCDSSGEDYNGVLPLCFPGAEWMNRLLSTRLFKSYHAIVCTRNPLLSIPQQRIALLCSSLTQLISQLMFAKKKNKSKAHMEGYIRLLFRLLLDISLEVKRVHLDSQWTGMVEKLAEPMPGRFLTEAKEDDVVSVTQVVAALLVMINPVSRAGVITSDVQRQEQQKQDNNDITTDHNRRPQLERTESMVCHDVRVEDAALAVLAESVSRGVRIQIKQRSNVRNKSEDQSELILLRHTLGIDAHDHLHVLPDDQQEPVNIQHENAFDVEKAKLRSGKFFRRQWTNCPPTAVVGAFGLVNILHSHLGEITRAMDPHGDPEQIVALDIFPNEETRANESKKEEITSLNLFSDEDDDDEEEGEEEQEAVKQGSGDKKEIKNYTTPKPITTTTTQTNLTFEQRVFSFLSSDRASALRQRIATAFEDVSMSSFADTYTNEECDVWDLQIALYVQAILFHNSKTRRRGLPSLRQPRKVIEDAASHARQKMYEMELKKKIDRIRVKMASEKAFDRRGYQLQLQHMFLLAHGDLPRTFTPAEVSEMNAARPLDDQIELTPSGLPRHRCAHVNCAKYLEDLSTDRDRSLGTRHGLYKHLSPLMHPEVQYMPRYHLFIQTLRVKEWTSDKKFVEDAMEKYSRWKGKSLPRDQKKCLRSFLQITWAMNSGAN
eukprot:m.98722 g.98722  ORF g.98722 m.98722 type:complete len:2306 (+) comp12528_c0_seq2:34-6951(+)